MLLTALVGLIFVIVLAGLVGGAVVIYRRQSELTAKREAAQLQRRGDHLFKIALAAQVHTRSGAIARTLLDEAVRVLEYSLQLDRDSEATATTLRECRELIVNIGADPEPRSELKDPILEFPETELIEAQLHLTEAMRLLIGLEKRGRISYGALAEMSLVIKQAQRAVDLRLQLQQAAHGLDEERNIPKFDELRAREYFAELERNRVRPSH